MKLIKFEFKKLFPTAQRLSLVLLLILPFSAVFAHPQHQSLQDLAVNPGHYMTHPEVLVALFALATATIVRSKLKKKASKR